jgi:hypothetical protein
MAKAKIIPMKKRMNPPPSESACQLELARLRAQHHVRDGARILADAVYLIPNMEARVAVTSIVGQLQTIEQRLTDLEAK